MMGY
jgi:dodecin